MALTSWDLDYANSRVDFVFDTDVHNSGWELADMSHAAFQTSASDSGTTIAGSSFSYTNSNRTLRVVLSKNDIARLVDHGLLDTDSAYLTTQSGFIAEHAAVSDLKANSVSNASLPTIDKWELNTITGKAVFTFSRPVKTVDVTKFVLHDAASGGDQYILTSNTTSAITNLSRIVTLTMGSTDLAEVRDVINSHHPKAWVYLNAAAVVDPFDQNSAAQGRTQADTVITPTEAHAGGEGGPGRSRLAVGDVGRARTRQPRWVRPNSQKALKPVGRR